MSNISFQVKTSQMLLLLKKFYLYIYCETFEHGKVVASTTINILIHPLPFFVRLGNFGSRFYIMC